jgi:phage shock protein A
MLVAIACFQMYQGVMPEQRIADLEQQLLAANENVAKLTASNTLLTSQLESAELRNRKLRKSAGRDERDHKEALTAAQNARRG